MANPIDTEQEQVEYGSLASLSEDLVYRLPGCSDLMVRKTLQEVYRDFCSRSWCLSFTESGETPEDGAYYIPRRIGSLSHVAEVSVGRRVLEQGRDWTLSRTPSPVVFLRLRPCRAFHQTHPRHPEVEEDCMRHGCRAERERVRVKWVEIPGIGCERCPGWFLERHGDAICHGVLAKLMSMTGRAWSDQAQASSELVQYENAVNFANAEYYGGPISSPNAAMPLDLL